MGKNTMGEENRIFGEHWYNLLQMSMEKEEGRKEGRTLSLLRGNIRTGVFATQDHKCKNTSRKTTSRGNGFFLLLCEKINAKQIRGGNKERGAVRDGEREEELGKPSLGEMTPFSAAPGSSS